MRILCKGGPGERLDRKRDVDDFQELPGINEREQTDVGKSFEGRLGSHQMTLKIMRGWVANRKPQRKGEEGRVQAAQRIF